MALYGTYNVQYVTTVIVIVGAGMKRLYHLFVALLQPSLLHYIYVSF